MFKNMKYVTITITLLKVALRTQNYREWQQTGLNNHASIYKLNSLYFPSLKFILNQSKPSKKLQKFLPPEFSKRKNTKGLFD